MRSQKATKDLVAQAETTVALGKGAVTTVRKAATDIERVRQGDADDRTPRGRRRRGDRRRVRADETQQAAKVVQESAAHPHRGQADRHHHDEARRDHQDVHEGRGHQGARKTAAASKKATTATANKVGD